MSDDTTTVAPETGASDDSTNGAQFNITETVESLTQKLAKYKEIASTQEKRAKANAEAAKELEAIKESQKSEADKQAEKLAAADKALASVPSLVADALKAHLVELHQIEAEDAELFLTAAEPELLLKQVARFVGQSDKPKSNHVPSEGRNSGGAMALNSDELENMLKAKLGIQ